MTFFDTPDSKFENSMKFSKYFWTLCNIPIQFHEISLKSVRKPMTLRSNIANLRSLLQKSGKNWEIQKNYAKLVNLWVWRGQKNAYLVDLEKCFKQCAYSRYQRRRYSRERAFQSFYGMGVPNRGCTRHLVGQLRLHLAYPSPTLVFHISCGGLLR